MTTACRNNKGFTLIELLIVVAVIGVLAAIAIPLFANYRMRAYNATTISDMTEVKLMLEAYYSDQKHYP